MQKIRFAAIALVFSLFASQSANAGPLFKPNMEPFECNNTESMNVAKYVLQGTFEPLMLETVVHGDTCGYEGGVITGADGVTLRHMVIQIAGTDSGTSSLAGFGPYLEIYYNNGNSVNVLAVKSAGEFFITGDYAQREFFESDFGLPAGAVVSGIRFITNPTSAEDGKCFLRQVRINGALVTKTRGVINACP